MGLRRADAGQDESPRRQQSKTKTKRKSKKKRMRRLDTDGYVVNGKSKKNKSNQANGNDSLSTKWIGRPRILSSPEELYRRVLVWVHEMAVRGEPLTMHGAALAVGLASPVSFDDYASKSPEYAVAIKWVRTLVTDQLVRKLISGRGSAAGIMFVLYNMGWQNPRYQVDHRHDHEHKGAIAHVHAHRIDATKLDDRVLEMLVDAIEIAPEVRPGDGKVIEGEVVRRH